MAAIDVIFQDTRWESEPLDDLCDDAIVATLAHLELSNDGLTLSVVGCDDNHIAELNAKYRGKPSPTNVLSWQAQVLSPETAGAIPQSPKPDTFGETPLGDIAIAYDTCVREAVEQEKSFTAHVSHLIVHGTLHLLGYDHETDADAARMEELEVEILEKLGIANPY